MAAAVALVFAAFSLWVAGRWVPALVPAGLFLTFSLAGLYLATRPAIELHSSHLVMGNVRIPWRRIRRVDCTSWVAPVMVIRLTLADNRRITVIYPGDPESARSLHHQIRRGAREALIDGVPYREYWCEPVKAPDRRSMPRPRYRLLREEDEAEVEQLYQRLKKVGYLDSSNGGSSEDERT